ncbi:MAG: preprotein translocase subunit YajC [Opitutales bacterium]|nr:preprotein translocase subunit YajC [Opitutales bacterium]
MYENMLSHSTFLAQAAAPKGDGMFSLLIMALLFIGMMFILNSSQRKRQKEHKTMMDSLKNGDEVLTAGGLYATIVKIKDDQRVEVRLSDDTRVQLNKSFIQSKVSKD